MSNINSTPVEILQDTADAIRGKTGGTADLKPYQFPAEIDSIQTGGGGGVVEKDVNFYTPYGDLVASWTMAEARAATELPAAPELPRLTFQEWNWSLAEIKVEDKALDVGGTYVTASGKTEFDFTFTAVSGLAVSLAINNKVSGGLISVDWGDGATENASTTTVGTKTFTHTYSVVGDYIVSVDSTAEYELYGTAATPYNMFGGIPNYTCVAVRCGTRCVALAGDTFRNCTSLSKVVLSKFVLSMGDYPFQLNYGIGNITLPKSITALNGAFRAMYRLCSVQIPPSTISFGTYLFYHDHSLVRAVLPTNLTSAAATNYMFGSCNVLREIIFPKISSLGIQAAATCYNLQRAVIPDTVINIENQAFASNNGTMEYIFLRSAPPTLANTGAFTGINQLCKIKVPQGSLNAYRTATNWATYANHIVEMTNDEMIKYGLAVTP